MMKTLFLQPPSFDGFDGGAGSRYQAKREIKSFWYPTWLAQPAALVPGSKLIDAPPARTTLEDGDRSRARPRPRRHAHQHPLLPVGREASPKPSRPPNPASRSAWSGAKVAVQPNESLQQGRQAIDFVARNEFDFTIKEVAEGRDWSPDIDGITWRDANGTLDHRQQGPRHPRGHGFSCPSST